MKYASVCDGIGAVHVAWKPLGWQCAWTSEIEPFPAAVVEHHLGLKNLGDMTAITEETLDGVAAGPVDLLVGGTPCQSFSVAGLRRGLDDPRGNLALRFLQLAGVLRPTWVVWENVPGVLSSAGGRDFGTFLGALGELGYGVAYRVLDAQWFGVAQRRRRVFVVGHARDWRCAAAVLFERESLCGNPPSRGAPWQGIARTTASSLTGSGRGIARTGESRGQDDLVLHAPRVANPLTARMAKGINTTCDEGQTPVVVSDDGAATASTQGFPDPAYALSAGAQGKGGVFGSGRDSQDTFVVSDDPTHAICANEQRTYTNEWNVFQLRNVVAQPFAFKPSHFTRGKDGAPSEVTPPLSADADKGDQDPVVAQPAAAVRPIGAMQGMAVRRLTPRECERLQGFPDDYTAITFKGKPAVDGPRYKALGNSMAVPVMRWIGERIALVERVVT